MLYSWLKEMEMDRLLDLVNYKLYRFSCSCLYPSHCLDLVVENGIPLESHGVVPEVIFSLYMGQNLSILEKIKFLFLFLFKGWSFAEVHLREEDIDEVLKILSSVKQVKDKVDEII